MDNEYKIEKGVPIPAPGRAVATIVEVVRSMEIGDSFVANHPPTTFYGAAKYNNMKVSVRKLEGGGFRIWRIK